MGCDITIIVEIKKNERWSYVEDVPKSFQDRNYGVFSVLNRNIRNYNRIDGFEPNGLPKDLSIKKCRFISEKKFILNTYENGEELVCIKPDGTFLSVFDESLKVLVDDKLYDDYQNGKLDMSRYHYSMFGNKDGKYLQDASLVNGKFEKKKYFEIYPTIEDFNNEYYHRTIFEDDIGYFEVDFESKDLYGHSYLTLAELKTKDKSEQQGKCYTIDKEFYNHLIDELEELPEVFVLLKEEKKTVDIIWSPDPEKTMIFSVYSDGIREIEKIKEKYKIKNDNDIRIVFGFDS